MAELLVNYSGIDALKSSIDQARRSLSSRCDFLDSSGRKIGGVSTSRGYLGAAVSELYGRSQAIGDKMDKLDKFQRDLEDFKQEAQEADQRVANRISQDTGSFCYSMGIEVTTPLGSWWKGVCNDVEAWYNEHKEIIGAIVNLAVDVVFCALAVAAFVATLPASGFFAVCAAIGAGFSLAKSVADVVTSSVSLYCYANGDSQGGAEWADRGLKDGFLYVGRSMDDALGTGNFFEGFATFAYGGLEVTSIAYALKDLKSMGKGVLKSFKLDKLSWKNVFSRSFAQNKAWFKSIDWKSRFTNPKNWTSALREITGIKKMPYGSSEGYQKLKKSFNWASNLLTGKPLQSTTITSLVRFKTYGDGFKYSYKAVTAIFDGDSSTSGWEGIKLGSKLKDLTTGLTSGNSLEGWAMMAT